jgi:hypothetical protein
MPFYLAYLRQASAEAGDPVEIIPPKTTQSFEFAAYCMDRNYAAPGVNEQFQLVPTSSLVPPEMLPAYKGALRYAAQSVRAHDSSVQGLMWQMRDTASGRALTQPQLSLSPQQQSILNSGDPNAVSLLQNYYQRNDEARKKVETTRKAVRIAAKLLGMDLSAINPSRIISPITNSEAIRSIQATTRSLEAMKPGGRVLGQNSGYSMIGEGVAAHAFSPNGGLRSINVRIANATSKPVAFSPKSCAAQSTRKVQRLAIQPNYAAKTTRPRADIFAPQYGRFDRASYTTFADPQARMTRLVWNGERPTMTLAQVQAVYALPLLVGMAAVATGMSVQEAQSLSATQQTALVTRWILGTVSGNLRYGMIHMNQSSEDCADGTGRGECTSQEAQSSEKLEPPGDCSKGQHREMQDRVDRACRETRSCEKKLPKSSLNNGLDRLQAIQQRIDAGRACVAAREAINNVCFRGGDSTHRNELAKAKDVLKICENLQI